MTNIVDQLNFAFVLLKFSLIILSICGTVSTVALLCILNDIHQMRSLRMHQQRVWEAQQGVRHPPAS